MKIFRCTARLPVDDLEENLPSNASTDDALDRIFSHEKISSMSSFSDVVEDEDTKQDSIPILQPSPLATKISFQEPPESKNSDQIFENATPAFKPDLKNLTQRRSVLPQSVRRNFQNINK